LFHGKLKGSRGLRGVAAAGTAFGMGFHPLLIMKKGMSPIFAQDFYFFWIFLFVGTKGLGV